MGNHDDSSDQSDDLVSLSSVESSFDQFPDSEDNDQNIHKTSLTDLTSKTTEYIQTDDCSSTCTSEDWFKVDPNVNLTTPTQPLPLPTREDSQETESYVSSAKTIEVLSSSLYKDCNLLDNTPVSASGPVVEDCDTERTKETVVASSSLAEGECSTLTDKCVQQGMCVLMCICILACV